MTCRRARHERSRSRVGVTMRAIHATDPPSTAPPPSDRGDELDAFCRREHPRLVGALSLYCGDRHVAEEIAADALVRAIDRWDRVRTMRAPGAWVHRVAMNLVNSRFRRVAAERRARSRLGGGDDPTDPATADAMTVRQAVAALPEPQRRCLVLRFYLGYELSEVADELGRTPQAVAALTYRALERLRADLGDDRVTFEDERRDG